MYTNIFAYVCGKISIRFSSDYRWPLNNKLPQKGRFPKKEIFPKNCNLATLCKCGSAFARETQNSNMFK